MLPIGWSLRPAQIAARCKASIAAIRRRVDTIVRLPRAKRGFATVVLPLETAAADYNDDLVAQTFLYKVSTDAKVRAASLKCSTMESSV